jgi:hypothetical protein
VPIKLPIKLLPCSVHGLKWPKKDVKHLLSSSDKGKNEWSITLTPAIVVPLHLPF